LRKASVNPRIYAWWSLLTGEYIVPNYTAKTTGGTLRASNSNDTITGSSVTDILWGLGGDDVITGGDGDDTIEGDGTYTVADAVRETGIATISNSTITLISLTPSLTAMGVLDSGASVWRIRNTSNGDMTAVLQAANGGTPIKVVVPAHSDSFVTDVVGGIHTLSMNGLAIEFKIPVMTAFVETDAYGTTIDGN
jgi:Ca2+-binding RTX toxin-like protein